MILKNKQLLSFMIKGKNRLYIDNMQMVGYIIRYFAISSTFNLLLNNNSNI